MVLTRASLIVAGVLLAAAAPPPFTRYPATPMPAAQASAPRLTDPLSRRFRSALAEAATKQPDFAGGYVLAEIGCGAGCIRAAAINRASGRVAWFPATISGWPLAVQEPLVYRRDSRLLIVQGMLDEKGSAATRAYLFDGTHFRPLDGPVDQGARRIDR